MSVSDADIAFAFELLDDVERITGRKMFGAMGLYRDGVIFGLISDEGTIYLKATELFADELQSGGGERFRNMPYWSLPEHVLETPEEACALAHRAIKLLK